MQGIAVKIKPLHVGIRIAPLRYQTDGAAGFDLCAAIDEEIMLWPHERRLIPCGFAIELPQGYEAQVRPRSGLALKHGITVLNAPGTIDSDYRGEVGALLMNLGGEPFVINPAARIAQMVIARYTTADLQLVEELSDTARGAGGFGSTGTSQ